MNFRRFGVYSSSAIAFAAACMAVLNCKDDDNNNVLDDGGVSQFEDVVLPDSQAPPTKNQATILAIELKNQPKAGVPDKIFPSAVVQLQSRPPRRFPDVGQKGLVDIEGFGCAGYKDPKHPEFADLDMGNVVIEGLTGAAPKPLKCALVETQPVVFPGIFNYTCAGRDFPPYLQGGLALRYPPLGPGERFINKTDKLVASTTGGKDVKAIPKNEPIPQIPIDNLVVTSDLWNVKPADVDGSKDLVIQYNCGGGPCVQGVAMSVTMVTTDGTSPPPDDGGKEDPYTFPFPSQNNKFGLILCQEMMNYAKNELRIDKSVLPVLGTSWTKLFVQVSALGNAINASPDNDKIVVGPGVGVFGITKHP